MKLQQGQIWQRANEFIHIVQVQRLEVQYKLRTKLTSKDGTHHTLSKKEFCRLLKTAELVPTSELEPVAHAPYTGLPRKGRP
jgi:hypothetical protein